MQTSTWLAKHTVTEWVTDKARQGSELNEKEICSGTVSHRQNQQHSFSWLSLNTNFYIILFQGQLIDDIHEATLTAQIEKNPKDGFWY